MPCSNGLYLSPKMVTTVDSIAQPLNVSWDPTCLTADEVDIYLYAPNSPLPRIHLWEHVARSRGSYAAQLMPRWWNATSSQQLQIIIVPTGDPPFLSTFPAGPVFTATYSSSGSSPPPAAADTSIIDSGVTRVNDLANQRASKSAVSGRAAAGVLVPLLLIALAVFAYIKWRRRKQNQKRKAWTEKVDKRMSTISTDWKSVSAAGAQAAIRNSIAVGSRNSSFSFGAIRPNSTLELNDSDSSDNRNPAIRTGTGVGLRNPNALSSSRNSTTSTRVSRVSFAPDPRVSRVSFAESTDSSSINRKNASSRAFHSAYIPPVPALPEGITSVYIPEKSQEKEKGNLSPRQTAGPLTLTPDDIKARIAASVSGKPNKGSMSGLDDEMMPALSMMRTGNMETSETDDFLLPTGAPQLPEQTYSPLTPTITSAFPVPPTNTQPAAPSVVLSPDEMLRAYAERKKSLADAARAGRIGGPLRASVVPSIAASAITTQSGSTVNNSVNSGGRVETVSSIHATGMRVAYNDADGLVLPPPSLPSGYQEGRGSPQTKPILPLSLSGKGSKGIEGGKALLGKVKSMGKKRKSMNPFAKADPEVSVTEDGEEYEADADNNPGEAYVAALEAEAAETEAERQLNATHNLGDDVVGAYPYAYDQQPQQQYFGGYEGQQYYGYGYQYGEEQGEGGEYVYENGEEAQQGRQAYGY